MPKNFFFIKILFTKIKEIKQLGLTKKHKERPQAEKMVRPFKIKNLFPNSHLHLVRFIDGIKIISNQTAAKLNLERLLKTSSANKEIR